MLDGSQRGTVVGLMQNVAFDVRPAGCTLMAKIQKCILQDTYVGTHHLQSSQMHFFPQPYTYTGWK